MKNRIAINGRYLNRRFTGVERYAFEISRHLGGDARTVRSKYALPAIIGQLWEQFYLPLELKPGEVLWSPANTGPLFIESQVLTIHDLSPIDHPEWFSPLFAFWYARLWKVLVHRVREIIVPSNFSKQRLVSMFEVEPDKVILAPGGVGSEFHPVSRTIGEAIRKRYQINGDYVLFVGTQEPRKNLRTLFQAWKHVRQAFPHLILVLAGGRGKVFRGTGYSSTPEGAIQLGYVPEDQLPALYSEALVTVLPSLYEGFGFTLLEAMACATPVISSNTTALPELVGEAGLYVNPYDEGQIAETICQVVDNPSLRQSLSQKGIEQSRRYSWENAARSVKHTLLSS